jgi:hypothetical protein
MSTVGGNVIRRKKIVTELKKNINLEPSRKSLNEHSAVKIFI